MSAQLFLMDHSLVLFDGVCNFCDSSVHFIIARDPQARFRFASLQGEAGRAVLRKHHHFGTGLDTIILVEGDKIYTRSTAVLRIVRRLRGGWPLLALLLLVPVFARDLVYGLIARNRYRWFGKLDVCTVPGPELRERFLD